MLCLALLVAHAGAHQTLSATQVVERAQAAYDRVNTFTEDVVGSEKMGSGTAHIQFKRPGLLHVTGKAMFGAPYQLLCDGTSTRVFNANNWSTVQNTEIGVATVTGLSMNAAMAVPAALLHTKWGALPNGETGGKVARDTVAGRSTIRVEFAKPFARKLWFDAKTYFLVKTETSIMNTTITVNFGKPIVDKPIPASAFRK